VNRSTAAFLGLTPVRVMDWQMRHGYFIHAEYQAALDVVHAVMTGTYRPTGRATASRTPQGESVDTRIEYVVRLDDVGHMDHLQPGRFIAQPFLYGAGSYRATLEMAHRYATAEAAAKWIERRQQEFAAQYGGAFSIVPVKVTTAAAVTREEQVEVKPAGTGYIIRDLNDQTVVKEITDRNTFIWFARRPALVFPTADAAATAIRRNPHGSYDGWKLAIIPVSTPAEVSTKQVEVSPATTKVELL